MRHWFSSVFLVLLLAMPGYSNTPERTYTIGVASWVGWSFLHVADAQGFFQDAGLNVQVKWYGEPHQISEAFEKGELDFRLDFVASVVQEYANGHDIKLLAETNWSHGGDKIIAKRGVNLASRKGATIGIYRDSPALIYFLSVYLNRHKLRLSDFKVRNMGLEKLIKDFVSDEISFAVIFDPYTIDVVKKGDGAVKANSAQFPGCMPEGMYTKRETLENMPRKDLVALMGACVQASEWMREDKNWPRLRFLLNNHAFPDKGDYEDKQLKAMLRFVKIHNGKVLYNRNKEGGGLYKYLTDLKKFLKRNRMITKDFENDELLDASALLEALEATSN